MRDYDAPTDAAIAALGGMVARRLVWIEATNKSTGATETLGLWSGAETRSFTINGQTRQYIGAGSILGGDPIRAGVGARVRMHEVSLSSVPPEIQEMIYLYKTRFAPVEVHRAVFDVQTNALVGEPHRIIKGTIDSFPVPRPAKGESGPIKVKIAPASRNLTRTLTATKSDATQRSINPADKGRLYSAVSGAVAVFWGQKRSDE